MESILRALPVESPTLLTETSKVEFPLISVFVVSSEQQHWLSAHSNLTRAQHAFPFAKMTRKAESAICARHRLRSAQLWACASI